MRSFLFAVNCANKTLPAIFFFFFLFTASSFYVFFRFFFFAPSLLLFIHSPNMHTRTAVVLLSTFLFYRFSELQKKKKVQNEIIINMYTYIYIKRCTKKSSFSAAENGRKKDLRKNK